MWQHQSDLEVAPNLVLSTFTELQPDNNILKAVFAL